MRFEIVTTEASQRYHARIVGDNGEIVWVTENYARKFDAIHAVTTLAETFGHHGSQFVFDRPLGTTDGVLRLSHDDQGDPVGPVIREVKE